MRTAPEPSLLSRIWPALAVCLVIDCACCWGVLRVLDWFGF